MPRSSSHASVWPRMVPSCARIVRSFCQYSSSRAPTRAPAMMSEWPLRYLVAECMTMSAPSSIGRVSTGVPTVEVDAEQRAGAMGDLGGRGDVGDAPRRIGRRLDPHQLGRAGPDGGGDGVGAVGVDEVDLEAPLRARSPPASCAATSTSPWAPRRGRPAPAPGSRPSPHSCPRRRSAPWARLRARPASPRPGRRSDCRAARRCGRSCSRCPRRADRCWPCGSAAPRPSSPDRSNPLLVLRAKKQRRSCLSSRYRQLTCCLHMRVLL